MPDKIKYKTGTKKEMVRDNGVRTKSKTLNAIEGDRKDKKPKTLGQLNKKWYRRSDGGSKERDIGKVYTIKKKNTLPDGTKVKSKTKIYGGRRNKLKKMVRGNGVRMKSKSISPDGQVRKVIKNKDKGWNN